MQILSILLLVLAFSFVEKAYAYLDPGTGSLVLQYIIAGVAGSIFFIKMFWHRLVGYFRKDEEPKKIIRGEGKSND